MKAQYCVDDDTPTPIEVVGAYPVYRRAASELAEKVLDLGRSKPHTRMVAPLMYEELKWYEEQFASWNGQDPPDDAVRSRHVKEFTLVYRGIHNYVTANSTDSSVMPKKF